MAEEHARAAQYEYGAVSLQRESVCGPRLTRVWSRDTFVVAYPSTV